MDDLAGRDSSERLNPLEIQALFQKTRSELLRLRSGAGVWEGELSASALSTATAVVALKLAERHGAIGAAVSAHLAGKGLDWLRHHANADGGWGDTVLSQSNISTTLLAWAALGMEGGGSGQDGAVVTAAEKWLEERAGSLEPDRIAAAVIGRYGSDRTFSVPILTHCALAGGLGSGRKAWRHVIPLPFELAAFPPGFFAALRLPVVSYALPALIAIGYARHFHAPTRNPLRKGLRDLATRRVFRVLDAIQPPNGGFLEATPLTSFVTMSLAASGRANHPVVRRGLEFLVNSAQPDGSWRIDTNLSTWATTLSVNALGSDGMTSPGDGERSVVIGWLLGQQYRSRHLYTNAPPGGWAWTDLPGGVPDADDTAGALLALRALSPNTSEAAEAAAAGVEWLLNLQNRDGGIPTFCRGWGALPFDQSSADLTAHALRAWAAWRDSVPAGLQRRITAATVRAVRFLTRVQRPDGSWRPLWFGNERQEDESNPVYGTSRVLLALSETGLGKEQAVPAALWLAGARQVDGGWSGGSQPGPSSVEETSLAVEGLSAALTAQTELREALEPAILDGVRWLAARIGDQTWTKPSPIGFYFAKLWYFERLYPVIFTVAALGRAGRALQRR